MPDMHQTLQTLHMLLPAQGLLHIGAGLPSPGAWYQQWGLPTIDWIDASEQRHHLLAKHALPQAGEGHRQSHHALLGPDCAQEAQYYVLSNPQESGLIDAAALTALWPNITFRALRANWALRAIRANWASRANFALWALRASRANFAL